MSGLKLKLLYCGNQACSIVTPSLLWPWAAFFNTSLIARREWKPMTHEDTLNGNLKLLY
jgi:hypothetical protein